MRDNKVQYTNKHCSLLKSSCLIVVFFELQNTFCRTTCLWFFIRFHITRASIFTVKTPSNSTYITRYPELHIFILHLTAFSWHIIFTVIIHNNVKRASFLLVGKRPLKQTVRLLNMYWVLRSVIHFFHLPVIYAVEMDEIGRKKRCEIFSACMWGVWKTHFLEELSSFSLNSKIFIGKHTSLNIFDLNAFFQ